MMPHAVAQWCISRMEVSLYRTASSVRVAAWKELVNPLWSRSWHTAAVMRTKRSRSFSIVIASGVCRIRNTPWVT